MRTAGGLHRATVVLFALALWVAPLSAQPGAEASRVRVVLVLDTDDEAGATWRRDGENVRTVLEAGLHKQGLDGRYTLDIFTGQDVTPDRLLGHCRGLRVGSEEAVLFYYSGHGGYHRNKGHFLALTHGPLYRRDVLSALQEQRPRLIVLLTDCCSDYAGGAFQEEPAGAVKPIAGTGQRQKRALLQEPAAQVRIGRADPRRAIKAERPNTAVLLHAAKASQQEPPASVARALQGTSRPTSPKARVEEPPVHRVGDARALLTSAGRVRLSDIEERSDGEVLRHLLFRPRGVVDINGCTKGHLSHGALEWGGSLFTNAFLGLQRERTGHFDKNSNQVVEWDEFFPPWQQGTTDAGQRVSRGRIQQVPEANRLAK
jgi:hypothetical protein